MTKTHPEFKSVYNHTLQGVAFALVRVFSHSSLFFSLLCVYYRAYGCMYAFVQRATIKLHPVEEKIVDRLVGIHLGMYTGSTLFDEGPPIP